jgi:hypothetical protein
MQTAALSAAENITAEAVIVIEGSGLRFLVRLADPAATYSPMP